jgi:hypothetical protein
MKLALPTSKKLVVKKRSSHNFIVDMQEKRSSTAVNVYKASSGLARPGSNQMSPKSIGNAINGEVS